jgi:hypothetical protein
VHKNEGDEIRRIWVDNDIAMNILPLSILQVIGKIVEYLTPTKIVISG